MKDIRISFGFWDHWKTMSLAADLGLEGPVALQRLWIFAAQNKPNGVLTGLPVRAIEMAARWTGQPGVLLEKLIELAFITVDDDGCYVLHDWEEHNGYAYHSSVRSDAARKAAETRWNSKRTTDSNAECNAERITECNAERITECNPPSPYPSPKPKQENLLPEHDAPALPEVKKPAKPKKATDPRHGWFLRWFVWSCTETTGATYRPVKADAGIVKGLLRFPIEELVGRACAYLLLSDDQRFPRGSPSFRGLAGMIDQLAGKDTVDVDRRATSLGLLPPPGTKLANFTPWSTDESHKLQAA